MNFTVREIILNNVDVKENVIDFITCSMSNNDMPVNTVLVTQEVIFQFNLIKR
jgi:hypothetical protein